VPVSLPQLRRYLVAHQRFATRPRSGSAEDVAAAVRRLGAVQLDSISTVDRAHRLTLVSRVGAYPRGTVSQLLGQGRIFEYWTHEACLLPLRDAFERALARLAHALGLERVESPPLERS